MEINVRITACVYTLRPSGFFYSPLEVTFI